MQRLQPQTQQEEKICQLNPDQFQPEMPMQRDAKETAQTTFIAHIDKQSHHAFFPAKATHRQALRHNASLTPAPTKLCAEQQQAHSALASHEQAGELKSPTGPRRLRIAADGRYKCRTPSICRRTQPCPCTWAECHENTLHEARCRVQS